MKLISTRLYLGFLLVIIVLSGLILLFTFRAIKESYIENFKKNLEDINISLQPTLYNILSQGDMDYLQEYVVSLGSELNTRITLINKDGVVIADSKVHPRELDNHISRPEISDVINGKAKSSSIRYSHSVNGDMLYVAMPLRTNGDFEIVCRISILLQDINLLLSNISQDIFKVVLIVVIVSLIAVLFFTRSITKPINELSLASQQLASGDFNIKVKAKGNDEISILIQSFNEMVSKLKDLFRVVNSQKEEYDTLISSIQEGLMVLNADGNIILSNKSFNNIIGLKSVINKHYSELIHDKEFIKINKLIKKKKKGFNKEIVINNEAFLCSVSFIESKNEIVILFKNISEQKKLEKIKQDLVINVSHELRTPLTAIKGFVETLQDEIEDKQNLHYLDIIMRHTNRLINIVQDLLILSELEHENSQLLLSKVDLYALCENVIKIFEYKINEKNLKLILTHDDELSKVVVDNFRIEQVIINLIDNAMKYTENGTITLNIEQDFDKVAITVSDTGVGIEQDDLKHIFDRFYKVDKARSSKVQSSGLGLSIVKHIVQLHEGSINVESKKGEGTKFSILLPINGPTKKSANEVRGSGNGELV